MIHHYNRIYIYNSNSSSSSRDDVNDYTTTPRGRYCYIMLHVSINRVTLLCCNISSISDVNIVLKYSTPPPHTTPLTHDVRRIYRYIYVKCVCVYIYIYMYDYDYIFIIQYKHTY